ncbi:hypothetical protein [Pseudonocardia zijingensis]|jgi:hypothetical protein
MDPPRTEAAFAAALPLAGLDAWRIYLGLPLPGARFPEGGVDALMRLGFEDAVQNLYGPISVQRWGAGSVCATRGRSRAGDRGADGLRRARARWPPAPPPPSWWGEQDDVDGFARPAGRLHEALARRSVAAEVVRVPGMGHGLAEIRHRARAAAAGGRGGGLAVDWFSRHLR